MDRLPQGFLIPHIGNHCTIITIIVVLLTLYISGCNNKTVRLQWNEEEGYRWAKLDIGYLGNSGFELHAPSNTNLTFKSSVTPEQVNDNQILLNGTGVATSDIDNDGLTDIYFPQIHGPNKLYKNLGGFRFRDVTEKAGVAHSGNYSRGALFEDVDGDRDPDLLVTTVSGRNALYMNDGTGVYSLKKDSGIKAGKGSTTMSMADIDADGDLDLFVANNKEKPVYDLFTEQELEAKNLVKRPEGKQIPGKTRYEFKEPFGKYYRFVYRKNMRAIMKEVGEYNRLYLNDGNGNFTDVTHEPGRFLDAKGDNAQLKPEWSLTARFQDLNDDRRPDLYICNDYFTPDRFWINRGDGTFRAADHETIRNFSYSSMGIAVSDIDRDGYMDFFLTEMLSPDYERRARQFHSRDMRPERAKKGTYQPQYMKNSLYLNRGDHTFAEIAYHSGLEASEWSWATRFMDIDLDGYEDLLINTGYPYDAIDRDYSYNSSRYKSSIDLQTSPPLKLSNKIFRNGTDLTFSNMSEEWGFTERDISYGMASADFDNDGDLDLVSSRFGARPALYENKSNASRIAVRLEGRKANSAGIGATITLRGGPVTQQKQLVSGGDYLSDSDPLVVFAAGPDRLHRLVVDWPSGGQTVVDSVVQNRIYRIAEPDSSDGNKQVVAADKRTTFEDISRRLNHKHRDDSRDDWQMQPLLPMKLSSGGPALMWMDYDGDVDEDLFITAGTNGELKVFENSAEGKFGEGEFLSPEQEMKSDQHSIVGWETGEYSRTVVGVSAIEKDAGNRNTPSAIVYDMAGDGTVTRSDIPGISSSTGPLAAADYDGDGDMDLFIGGRAVPGQYPMNATSQLLANREGKFLRDPNNKSQFKDLGLVTGAVFSDIDRDGDPDLLLSREWDSLVLFINTDGLFRNATEEYGLSEYKGWWKGITTGDFNSDGLPDIAATNLGTNTPYQLRNNKPLKLFYSDFNMDGRTDILDAEFSPSLNAYVPRRKLYNYQPFRSMVTSRFSSYAEYAQSSLDQLLNISLQKLPAKQVNTLEHMIFINGGDSFRPGPLPARAQLATAMDVRLADYNNDGKEDLFLAQNFFDVPNGMKRMDDGRGQWLKGRGDGTFESIPAAVSGIRIYGQQRGAALADINDDGKIDLAVSQNDSTTKLYRNRTNNRGITVRFSGGEAAGTAIRMVYADGSKGPLREIRAGSGSGSSGSRTQVLGIDREKRVRQIEIIRSGQTRYRQIEDGKWRYTISVGKNRESEQSP